MNEEAIPISRPDGFNDEQWEAYCDGFREAMQLTSSAAAAWAAEISEKGKSDDAEHGECSECGGRLVKAMGSEDPVCPRCVG